jgi:protein SCO1
MTSITPQKSHAKLFALLIFIFLVIPAAAIYGVIKHNSPHAQTIKIDGAYLIPPKEINDFQLTDNTGKTFTKENLKGHWTMMFFGFTNCGMVCPTTLVSLNKMYLTLKKELPDKQLPQVVFVSVDPEQDTVEKINSYVTTFNSHFMGLRGEFSDLVPLEKQLHIVAVKMKGDSEEKDDYYYDHSAEILLINPNAEVQAYLSYPHKPEQLVKDYKLVIAVS